MNIISGQNVDLISPFPATETRRVFGWNHCYRTFTENDDTPNNIDDFTKHMELLLQICPSWGIIDKNRLTNSSHEAPLVGIGLFEPAGSRAGYFHVATARKAFRTGLIDEAGQLVIKALFESQPALTRLGAYMDDKNAPAKGLCRRMGFKFEGIAEDMVVRDGVPRSVVYFGLTRRNWQCLSTTLTPDSSDALAASTGQGLGFKEGAETAASPSPSPDSPPSAGAAAPTQQQAAALQVQ